MLKRVANAIRSIDALAVALVLLAPACGNDGPTNSSRIPDVAGIYTGPLTLTVDGNLIGTARMRMNVVQSGSRLTITASAEFDGQTAEMPALTGTVNETGVFTPTGGGASTLFDDPDCGTVTITSWGLTFSGDTVRYGERAATSACGTWEISATLSR